MEDAFARGPDFVLPGQRKSIAPIPACQRLLVDVEPAHADATPLALAGGSVRHAAAASDQAGSAHRGTKDASLPAITTGNAGSSAIRVVADAHASPQHVIAAADWPTLVDADQPQRPPATETTQGIRMGPPTAYEATASSCVKASRQKLRHYLGELTGLVQIGGIGLTLEMLALVLRPLQVLLYILPLEVSRARLLLGSLVMFVLLHNLLESSMLE